ncbi:DHA1 family bicyclomycin/chloramphenicol resistance-like MFS transporter [Parvibaculum indicum]|uniref:multidrug effflux MFS transporter n=1 Tax=Parvibaculum indicum TaxID=562969 RepID=UPI001964C90D|nr:multidrug effflux MFS transporter [Parvibaculum indicum]NIJ41858.1 DHA1 family bicyclomycin/chloramphenicol resistance-like MFS transporter [Parvibaculum indicum]
MSGPDARHNMLLFVVILGALTAFGALSIDMYLPAFPAIKDDLQTTAGAVQRTLAVFFLGMAVGQPVLGPLSDRYGRLKPLLGGIAVYIAASLVAAQADSIEMLTAARFVQALGGCAGVVVARAMVRDLFDERESARVYSMLMLVMGVAPILAPVGGGFLVAAWGWQAIFWFLASFGVACFLAVLFGLGETLAEEDRSSGGFVYVLRGFQSLALDRQFTGFSLVGGLAMSAMFAYIAGSPFVFIDLVGVSPETFSLIFAMNAAGIIAASQANAFLLSRFAPRDLLRVALRVHLATSLALALCVWFSLGGLAGLMVPLFCMIASLGFIISNATAIAMARAGGYIGAGAALTGIIQFSLAGLAGALVSALNDGTAWPMAAVILLMSMGAVAVHLVARRP